MSYYYFLIVIVMLFIIGLDFFPFLFCWIICVTWTFFLIFLYSVSSIVKWILPSRIVIYVCYCSLCFFLGFKANGALRLLAWILFRTFNLLIVPYSSIIFIMYLSVISLLSLYVTNMFLVLINMHVLIKCSLESHAWHFFPLSAQLLLFFSTSACSCWCSLHWSSSFLWFGSISLCCFCSLVPFSSLILYYFATYHLDSFNV